MAKDDKEKQDDKLAQIIKDAGKKGKLGPKPKKPGKGGKK